MAYCTNCGKETSAKKFCEHCGVKQNKKHNFCAWCGTEFEVNVKVCPNCKEPKRIGTGIGKLFRVLAAAVILFVGVIYTLTAIISLPEGMVPAIVTLLIGILILPFTQRLFHKATHKHLKLRKVVRWIAPVVLTVALFLSLNSFTIIHGYSTAMKHWDETAYSAAMNYLTKNPEYKDSQKYIDKFESDVHNSLLKSPWWGGLERYDAYGDSIHYEFRADGTVLRRNVSWNMEKGMKLADYEDFEYKYTLTYDTNDETGLYEVRLDISSGDSYIMHLGANDSGVIVVNGFVEQSAGGITERLFTRDTTMPQ